eukprot:157369-Pleurochrysis_carterae.AAC.3
MRVGQDARAIAHGLERCWGGEGRARRGLEREAQGTDGGCENGRVGRRGACFGISSSGKEMQHKQITGRNVQAAVYMHCSKTKERGQPWSGSSIEGDGNVIRGSEDNGNRKRFRCLADDAADEL